MLVISHRGLTHPPAGDPPHPPIHENTIAAFERAVQGGVDGIETDVRLSADGKAILFHDRCLADGRAVATLSHRQIEHGVGYPVPLLDDVLGRFDLLWNLEIKSPDAVAAVIESLARPGAKDRVLVTSFRHDVIDHLAKETEVDLGLLITHRPVDLASSILAPWQPRSSVRSIVWDYNFVDRALLDQAAQAGWRNMVFGPHNRREHDLCRHWNIDAVITDHPRLATATPPNRQ